MNLVAQSLPSPVDPRASTLPPPPRPAAVLCDAIERTATGLAFLELRLLNAEETARYEHGLRIKAEARVEALEAEKTQLLKALRLADGLPVR